MSEWTDGKPTGTTGDPEPGRLRIVLRRWADLSAAPWKNGGGITREVAAMPERCAAADAFAWRVSVADVAQAGPFSRFDGVERTLVLLRGDGMLLDETGERTMTHALREPGDTARFDGAAPVAARLTGGPTRDFNLMVRRGAASGTLDVWREACVADLVADTILLHGAQGTWQVTVAGGETLTLDAGDTLLIDVQDAGPARDDPARRTLRASRRPVRIETRGAGLILAVVLRAGAHDA